MLDIKFIRQNSDLVKKNAVNKGVKVDIDRLLELDEQRRKSQTRIDSLRAQRRASSGSKPTPEEIDKLRKVGDEISKYEEDLKKINREYDKLLKSVPNIASSDTPVGPDESGNKVLRQWGKIPKFDFKPKEHHELGAALGLIDTAKAGEISGSRFWYLKGDLVLMEFALIQLAYSVLTSEKDLKKILAKAKIKLDSKPFTPVIPPVFIKPEIFAKMARLEPREERYHIPQDDLFLIGSAEHTLGPLHMNEILKEEDLPVRYAGFSTAFRREAGTYGKDMKGIFRGHQFDKLEMESFCLPEDSVAEQNFMVAIQEHLMQVLELPYQVVAICTGDMGGPDARQIDLEAWMPGQGKYRETHTADLMTDYQARRLDTRVRRKSGSVEFVHMNDATVFAGRPLIAILENYQQPDGSVKVPKVLQKYLGKKLIR
ncbi:MAG: serine--tRNA ligase [Patescibacteria group bacterium]